MPKLTRVTNKVFGQNATAIGDNPQIAQFGSAKAGTFIGTTDVETIQELPAYSNGWIDAVTPQNQFPALPEMTGVMKTMTYQTGYILQMGIPEYDDGTTYYNNSFCQVNGVIYKSTADENKGNNPTDENSEYWEKLELNGYQPPLLSSMWSDHLLNDTSWLRADTFTWQDGTVYKSVYDELEAQYNDEASIDEFELIKSVESFTRIGNPIIDYNDIASNFSASNYLLIQDNFAPTSGQTWEFNQHIKFNAISIQTFFGETTDAQGFAVSLVDDGTLRFYVGNSGWNIANDVASSNTLSANIWYDVKVSFNGTQYKVDVSTDNGSTWTNYITVNSTAIISSSQRRIGNHIGNQYFLNGSVNLTRTYIKIDDEYWWQPYPLSLSYKRTPKKYLIADVSQEEAILNKYNSKGIAWYYILDTENKRFKLPRTKFGFEGLRTNVGSDIEESLPNIKGSADLGLLSTLIYPFDYKEGALRFYSTDRNLSSNSGNSDYSGVLEVNASNSSATYQDDAPVQERATQMYLYFYVGGYTQTAIQQTAGLNAELFNNKLDLNAYNLNTQGKAYISGLGMPSDRYVNLTLGAYYSTYIAPANGYFTVHANTAGAFYLVKLLNGNEYYGVGGYKPNGTTMITLPVQKGETVRVSYDTIQNLGWFRFIYAEGEQ